MSSRGAAWCWRNTKLFCAGWEALPNAYLQIRQIPRFSKYSHSGISAHSPLLSRLRFLEIPPPHLEGICLPSPPPSVVNAPKPEHDGNSPANTIKSGMYQKANSRAKYSKNSKKQHFREFRDFGRGGGGGGSFSRNFAYFRYFAYFTNSGISIYLSNSIIQYIKLIHHAYIKFQD